MKQVLIDKSKIEKLQIEMADEETVITLANIDQIQDAAIRANVNELVKKLVFKTQDNGLEQKRIYLFEMSGNLVVECTWDDNMISATRTPLQTTWNILLKGSEKDNAMEYMPPIDDMFDTFARWIEGLM